MPLSESQLQALQNILSVAIGSGSTVLVQWISNKRSKSEKEEDTAKVLTSSASESVKAAQMVIDILQDVILDQKKYSDEQAKRIEENFSNQMNDLNSLITELKDDNEALRISVAELKKENTSLSVKLIQVKRENETLKTKYEDLKIKLSTYEANYITGNHEKAIEKVKEELKRGNKKSE